MHVLRYLWWNLSQLERPTRTLVSYQCVSSQNETITVHFCPCAIEWESSTSIDGLITSYNLSEDNTALLRAVRQFTEYYCAMSSTSDLV
jgi:hypothetical protein